ncbi:pentapeptide repeat-containing protein [Campylobacter volucris]|uniref:pentapeptide repeat-containing protein n=1 Tax=Campylobacter volucris TaxID=1031542 RepID=UPI0018A11921|nr:pentapeptide repeat-containing protein [Campylobacter volucris]MBF7068605.1 pentapeptide repeat-containing protein [Campylobacter volucris]
MEKFDKEQAIADIAKNLGISEENVSFDDKNKIYEIAKKSDGKPCDILKINESDKLSNLLNIYSLKFISCNFSKSIVIDNQNFKNRIIFRDIIFSENFNLNSSIFFKEVEFFGCFFKKNLHFEKCELKEKIIFLGINSLKAEFEHNTFEKEVYFGKEIDDRNVEKSNSFGSCSFRYVDFSNCHFLNEVYFKNNDFNQAIFRNSNFKDNVYFNNSHFKDYADFHACEFEKTACFYGVTFDKAPNFSQAIFKGNLNAVNAILNFTFDDLNEKIRLEYNSYENQRTIIEAGVIPNLYKEKPLNKFANDFRDSFRVFKSTLVKDNNALDASNFHKYELYCKEIELEEKKPKMFSKEWMDKWQLFFYRKLCDHHTNLLLNLKWLVITLGIFASIFLIIKINKYGISILDIFNTYWIYASSLGCFLLFVLAFFKCLEKMKSFVCVNLIIIFWVICYKPKIIFGIANLIGDNNYNIYENLLITIYTIIVGLILFSLQKTARKNSIMPN